MFLIFIVIFKYFIMELSVLFGFYNSDYFDRVVIIFNFLILVYEYLVEVNCPWQTLTTDVFFLCLQECIVFLCAWVSVALHICVYTLGFAFSFIALNLSILQTLEIALGT